VRHRQVFCDPQVRSSRRRAVARRASRTPNGRSARCGREEVQGRRSGRPRRITTRATERAAHQATDGAPIAGSSAVKASAKERSVVLGLNAERSAAPLEVRSNGTSAGGERDSSTPWTRRCGKRSTGEVGALTNREEASIEASSRCWSAGHRRVTFVSTVTRIGVLPPPGRRTRKVFVRRVVRVLAITPSGAFRRRCASCATSHRRSGRGAACRPPGTGRTAPGWVLLCDQPSDLLLEPALMPAGLWRLYVAEDPKTRGDVELV